MYTGGIDPEFLIKTPRLDAKDPYDPTPDRFKSRKAMAESIKEKRARKKNQWERPISHLIKNHPSLKGKEGEKIDGFKYHNFWGPLDFPVKHLALLNEVFDYFDEKNLREKIVPYLVRSASSSLRLLDWLVVDYAMDQPVVYSWKRSYEKEAAPLVLRQSYTQMLSRYRRRHFDPFRRKHRVYFSLGEEVYETTVGQLIFLMWAHEDGAIWYCENNYKEILQHMNDHIAAKTIEIEKDRQAGKKHKRTPFIKKGHKRSVVCKYEQKKMWHNESSSESEEEESGDESESST